MRQFLSVGLKVVKYFDHNEYVQKAISNAIYWLNKGENAGTWDDSFNPKDTMERKEPIEPIEVKGYQVDHTYQK